MPIKLHLRKANAYIVLFMISCNSANITSYDVISPPMFFPGGATAGRLGSILSWVKPKTLKLVSAVTLAKRSPINCSAEDEINRE